MGAGRLHKGPGTGTVLGGHWEGAGSRLANLLDSEATRLFVKLGWNGTRFNKAARATQFNNFRGTGVERRNLNTA